MTPLAPTPGADSAVDLDLDSVIGEIVSPDAPMQALEDPASSASQPSPTERAPESAATPERATGDGAVQVQQPATTTDVQSGSPDPLEGTEPFKYSVGNESKVLDGFYRVPGEGVMVPEDKVPQLEQLAVRAEMLDRASRESEQQNALYERLSEWTTTGPDGKEQTLKGVEAMVAHRVEHERQLAYRRVLDSYIENPNKLATLLVFNPETGNYEHNPDAWEHAKTLVDLERQRAEISVRGQLAQRYQEPPKPQEPDYKAAAPSVIQQMAQSANVDATVLTEQDRSFLSNQLARYIRPATAQDVRMNSSLQLNQPVVDLSFRDVVTDRIGLRKDALKRVEAAQDASKFNAGQDKGRQSGKTPPPQRPATKPSTEPKPKADWNAPLEEFLSEQGIPR